MHKKSIFTILGVMLAVVVASLTLVFAVGPRVGAASEVVLNQESHFNITINGDVHELTGISDAGKSLINGKNFRVEIPSSVTRIGYGTFDGCSGLTSIEIPSSVTSIGGYAFRECSGLTSIEIPSGVTSIGNDVFAYCSGLTSIEIPSSVTSIDNLAFYGCSGLTSIEIPSGVTSIGYHAFEGCSGLTSIEIPSSITRIGSYAFYSCSGLTSIEIPSSVTSIGNYAFYECSGLTEIIVRNPDLINNSELTQYASKLHYGADKNTVEFVTNCATTVDNRTVDFGATTTEPTLQKEHYHLVGWYRDEAFTQLFTFDTPIKYNMRLYAKWEINHYTVTFWAYGGDTVAPQTVDYGSRANPQLAVTTKPGYRFLYWVADGETTPYDFDTPVMDDITLTAQWEAIPVEPENNEVQDTADNNALWLWIAGGVAAVFGGVGIVAGVVVAKKRKK